MSDITPALPSGRQLIQRYGNGKFHVSGVTYHGSVIIFPEKTIAWDVTSYEGFTSASFKPLSILERPIEVLLIGCGPRMGMPRADIRDYLKEFKIVPEWMDTAAACRTLNVLMLENRAAAAALIAVD